MGERRRFELILRLVGARGQPKVSGWSGLGWTGGYPDVLLDDGDQEAQLLEEELEEDRLLGPHALQEGRHDLRQERNALQAQRLEDEHHRLHHRVVVLSPKQQRNKSASSSTSRVVGRVVCVSLVVSCDEPETGRGRAGSS